LLGLCAATSVGAAILLGIVGATWIVRGFQTPRTSLKSVLAWGMTAVFVFALAIAPILFAHPGAYRQYLAHAAVHVGRGNFLVGFFTHWENEEFHRSITLACLLAAVLGLLCRARELTQRRWLRLWLGPLLAVGFVAVFLPDKLYYLWFVGPWMMAAAAVVWHAVGPRLHPLVLRGAMLWTAGLYAVAVAGFLRNAAVMLTLPASQALEANARQLHDLIPRGSRVLTDQAWWLLADRCVVFDRYFSRVPPETLDYLVLEGDGSGDPDVQSDVPSLPAEVIAMRFGVVQNSINTTPLVVLGRPLPGTALGFGTAVLRRLAD
jgi:hypothetical protein